MSVVVQSVPTDTPNRVTGQSAIGTLDNNDAVLAAAINAAVSDHTIYIPPGPIAAIQAAYNTLGAQGGGIILIGAGSYIVTDTPIIPADGVELRGSGNASIIQQTQTGVRAFNFSTGTANYMAFRDFKVNGTWLTNQSRGSDNDRCFAVNNVKRLIFSNVECTNSRQMSITAGQCTDVLVDGCRVTNSAADMINLTGSRRCIVVNNHLLHGSDDAIAIHQTAAAGNPPIEGHIVANNIVEDVNGIKLLGITKAIIANNTMRRVKGYGIFTLVGGVEGYADQVAVVISGNTITDIINTNKFGGGALNVGIYIGNATKSFAAPVVGGTVPIYTYPENLYYLSNAAGNQNAGLQGLTITGNSIMGFTLPAGLYSVWGYGLPFQATGYADVDLTSGFEFNSFGIEFDGASLTASVVGNHIEGVNTGVVTSSTYTWLDQLNVVGNTFRRFSNYGIGLQPASTAKFGRITINDNVFDGDPYFESANRTTPKDGTWATGVVFPAAYNGTTIKGATLRGNTFRNLQRVEHTAAGGTSSYEGNNYYMLPDTSMTLNNVNAAANKGIYTPDGLGHLSDRLIVEDSDPTSATYGQEIGRSIGKASALPSTGWHVTGMFVRSTAIVQAGTAGSQYTLLGWQRLTTGNANVLDTDWRAMRCLTGN